MLVWIDVENPPQVQYLQPFKPALESAGADVVVTARDYGETYDLLRAQGTPFTPVGQSYGAQKWRKAVGLGGRAAALANHFRKTGRPDVSLSASRAAAVASTVMRRRSFVIVDYEHVFLAVYRATGSFVFHPDVIAKAAFRARGIREDRLIPFRGLKEDLTFSQIDVDGVAPHALSDRGDGKVRALVRPAAEESHYYRSESGRLTLALLERLAADARAVVVFSPRYPRQLEYLSRFEWKTEPIVLDRAVPFLGLLKAVDLVISSGGTMLREAAYLGVPAYSLFKGDLGAVDRYLAELGRLTLLSSAHDFDAIALERRTHATPLRTNPELVHELAGRVLDAARRPTGVRSRG